MDIVRMAWCAANVADRVALAGMEGTLVIIGHAVRVCVHPLRPVVVAGPVVPGNRLGIGEVHGLAGDLETFGGGGHLSRGLGEAAAVVLDIDGRKVGG